MPRASRPSTRSTEDLRECLEDVLRRVEFALGCSTGSNVEDLQAAVKTLLVTHTAIEMAQATFFEITGREQSELSLLRARVQAAARLLATQTTFEVSPLAAVYLSGPRQQLN